MGGGKQCRPAAFSLKEGEYPVFDSAVELLHRMELGQIARLAQQYQQRFEERA